MVLEVTVEKLIEVVGHDGSEVLWPDQPEPLCRKGHHIEEMQYVAYQFGYSLVPFVAKFEYNPGAVEDMPFAQYDFSGRFQTVLNVYSGILLGNYPRGNAHAVAWNATERCIYDPDGFIFAEDRNNFQAEAFFARVRGTR